ncbi:alpha/beta hydrolase [Roseomonas gilardii]|uniref:Alpha/beta hydrolase n=1 Tax=Roseomonas gilardii TaxID=257708 RepID=A0A1L7ADT2_9PROT|nr:alpha/beta hydrolase [Roseomonas gilardii]APT56901.1 hypothetical protein RGI145_07095 [Roseomonas gilardii]MDT8331075.1 alpha/beta hydrolase [Roseomonas gilardii]
MLRIGERSLPRQRGRFARAGGEIAYEVTGEGPAIVFAHGLGGSHLSWWQQVPDLARDFRCVTFAHRGFHPSTDATPPLGLDGFAEDLLGLLDHLELPDAALVGQSMGGWSCLEVALRAPGRVRALVMSATSGTIDPRSAADLGDWPERAAEAAARCAGLGIHPAMGERAAREQPALHLLYRGIDESAEADKAALRPRLMAGRTRPAETVRSLAMPTLFVAGEEDIVFPPAAARALGGMVGRPAVIVPECGHSPYFERADGFNALLRDFLG